MTITLNGKPRDIPAPMPVTRLLDELGLTGKPVVVELDQSALSPSEHASTIVADGARVEIVVLAAGG